jgi:hydroxymethylbilane synthase
VRIRIGSRGSTLALAQTNAVADALRGRDHEVEVVVIQTAGDQRKEARFADIGAPGVFVREIESALLDGGIDLAVHSYKDLPSRGPDGLVVAAVPERLDPADHLIARREFVVAPEPPADAARVRPRSEGESGDVTARQSADGSEIDSADGLLPLIEGAVVGTASERRRALVRALRPDLELERIRGNVPTRLDKLRAGPYNAIILAGAGLQRLQRAPDAPSLGLDELLDVRLDPAVFVPSPAQGAIALQCRADDPVENALAPLHDQQAALPVRAERELLHLVDGGCSLPFGAWARVLDDRRLELTAVLEAGGELVRAHAHGADPEDLAVRVWETLEAATAGALERTAESGA